MPENKEKINFSVISDKDFIEKKDNENEKEIAKKLKRKERNRAYYLKNRERIKEKARRDYYLKKEESKKLKEPAEISAKEAVGKTEKPENGIPIFWILCALIGMGIIIWVSIRQKQLKPIPPPVQRYREFDVGRGKIIKIPIE